MSQADVTLSIDVRTSELEARLAILEKAVMAARRFVRFEIGRAELAAALEETQ